jgi:hypothetical protein
MPGPRPPDRQQHRSGADRGAIRPPAGQLAAHLPASAAGHLSAHQVGSITPQGLAHLPAPLRHVIAAAFASALPPLYAYLIPLLAVAFLLALLLKEIPLRAHTGLDAPQASPSPAGARPRPPRRRLHLPESRVRPELPRRPVNPDSLLSVLVVSARSERTSRRR